MLIDMDVTMSYKCISCGAFEFFDVNLFKFSIHKNMMYQCRCQNSRIKLVQAGRNRYAFSVPCMGCGSSHIYTLGREDFLNQEIKIYTCPLTGIKNFFIGKDDSVRKYVDNFERELDILIDGLGYDRYFVNTYVMMDTLNKIHDIAENGGLICECGNADIYVKLLKTGVFLECARCSGNKFISAVTNNDLKETLLKNSITLVEKKSEPARMF